MVGGVPSAPAAIPRTSVPGVMVIEEVIAVISKSERHRSGYSTMAGRTLLPGVNASAATRKAPAHSSRVRKAT